MLLSGVLNSTEQKEMHGGHAKVKIAHSKVQ
jgi:hypothetical protein